MTTLRRSLPPVAWLLLGVLCVQSLGTAAFQTEIASRASAAGLSRLDASMVSDLARFWALPGFGLGALVSWFRPRIALCLGLALSLSAALYAMRGDCDWRVVSAVVAIGGACSLIAVYASLAEQLELNGVAQRMAPVALFVSVEHLAALLTPKIGGFGGWTGAVCWALGLALSLGAVSVKSMAREHEPTTRQGSAWLSAGALVIFGAMGLPNSFMTPGEFEPSRTLVFEWTLCLGLLALGLFRGVWLSAWRALLFGLAVSAGCTLSAVVCYELHVPLVTWVWVVTAGLGGAALYAFAFAVLLGGGRRVSVVMLFWFFGITRGASSFYYWIQGQEMPGGSLGLIVALFSVPLLVALATWERRFTRWLMLDA
ncbi:MAG: hypothetical protein KC492_35940 [Myxococcales bacterium]|nr:hypothetical protein [Myxococcales bacterium]